VFSHKHRISFQTPEMGPPGGFDNLEYICFEPYLKDYTIWNLKLNERDDKDDDK